MLVTIKATSIIQAEVDIRRGRLIDGIIQAEVDKRRGRPIDGIMRSGTVIFSP